MANQDAPKGFRPVRHRSGGEIRTREYIVTTGQTIFRYDLIKLVAAGTVEEADANDGIAVIGVAAQYIDDSASAGGVKILVYDDPDIIFRVQCDSGTVPTAADVGATANHEATNGSAVTKNSAHELDASDIGTGLQMRIIGIYPEIDNTWLEHVDVEVVLLEHALNDVTTTI